MNTPLVPFRAGSPIMIAGPTGSGKTFWTNKLLKNQMFTEPVSSVYIVMEFIKHIMIKWKFPIENFMKDYQVWIKYKV